MPIQQQSKGQMPPKIVTSLQRLLHPSEEVHAVLKTEWKPSATIPILWMAITGSRCLLFSTLRGGQIFKSIQLKEINLIRSNVSGRLEILLNDRALTNLIVPIAPPFRQLISDALTLFRNRNSD